MCPAPRGVPRSSRHERGQPCPITDIELDGGVLIQFADLPADVFPQIQPQHYAFLVDDELFDRAYTRLREDGVEHWADSQRR